MPTFTKYIQNEEYYSEVISHIAKVRETLWSGSADIKDVYMKQDNEQTIRYFVKVLDILKPDLFVFLSSTVCTQAEELDYSRFMGGNLWDWTKTHGIKDYIYTMHPSSPHWNQPMPSNYDKAKYERKNLSACEFFCKWLKEKWVCG